MEKLYDRIDFHNNAAPALNESNLNAISKAIDDIDNRLIKVANSGPGGGGSDVDLEYYEQNGFLSRNLLKAELVSTSQYGVTLTKNGNEYIVNGTATGGTAIFIIGRVHLEQGKKYKIVGSKGSSADAFAYLVANGQWKRDYSTSANPFTSEITEDTDYIIRVVSGKTANNLTFRPMISEEVNDNYDSYMPYAPSNNDLQKQIDDMPGGGTVTEYGTTAEFEAEKDSFPVGTEYLVTDDYEEGGSDVTKPFNIVCSTISDIYNNVPDIGDSAIIQTDADLSNILAKYSAMGKFTAFRLTDTIVDLLGIIGNDYVYSIRLINNNVTYRGRIGFTSVV